MEDTILWKQESDRYFKRSLALDFSKENLAIAQGQVKKLIKIIPQKTKIKNILDIGCNCGVFTGFLAKFLPKAKVIGLDPSKKAINFAKAQYKNFPNLKFIVGHSSKLPFKKKFDIVIVRMVLQWLPRKNFFETIAEIDRVAHNFIYINEFSPLKASTSVSVHNKKVKIFKQDYYKIFTSVPYWVVFYQKIFDAQFGENYRRGIFILKKLSIDSAYKKGPSVQEKDKIIKFSK